MSQDDRSTYADPDEDASSRGDAAPADHDASRYVLGELIGKGGMGEVRAATDTLLDREVAIKVLREGASGWRERFFEEARVTAGLEHPNIVPVHDLGELEDGRPYLAMKRVRGRSLTELMTAGQLGPVESRLEIFRKLCDAVSFAHARGVLHRDLKPDNVMVGEFGEVVLMDWGIAASIELSEQGPHAATTSGAAGPILGTPAYMSPEQARGETSTAQTDVYGLGAVLYELLAGEPPFRGPPARVLIQVAEGMLVPPRQRAPALAPELERVILRAMAAEPTQRYASARALREDIDAVLARRPLVHTRSTPAERLAKWTDRHRRALRAAAVACGVVLVALALGSWRYASDVGEARDAAVEAAGRASAAEAEATAGLVAAQVALADALSGSGLVLEADDHLRAADALLRGRDLDRRALDLAWSQHVADNPPPIARCRPHGGEAIRALDIHADGRRALTLGNDGRLVLWDPVGCAELGAVRLNEDGASKAVIGAAVVDAKRDFAAAFIGDELVRASLPGGIISRIPAPAGSRSLGLDGTTLWVRDADANIWTLELGEETPRALVAPPVSGSFWRPAMGEALWLAESVRTGGELGGVWRARDGVGLVQDSGVNSLAISSDGRYVLFGSAVQLQTVDLLSGNRRALEQEPVHTVGIAPGDRVGWVQGFDGSVRLIDLVGGKLLAAYVGPGDLPSAIAATPDARLLVIAGGDGEALTYLRPSHPVRDPLPELDELAHGLALSADGQLLALGTESGDLRIVDTATSRTLRRWSGWETGVRQVAFSPDGRRVAAAVRHDGLAIIDLDSGRVQTTPLPVRTVSVAWLPEGVFSVDVEGGLLRLDPDTGVVTPLGQGLRAASWGLAALGPDELVSAGHMGKELGLAVISTGDGRLIRRVPLQSTGYHVAVSPDRARLAVATHAGQALIIDSASGDTRALQADAGPTMGVAFSPDGRLLATTGYSRQVKLWDVESGTLLRAVQQHGGPGLNVQFSPDGGVVYSTGSDGLRALPIRARELHESAVAALQQDSAGRAAALASLGWWERVEEAAGSSEADRVLIARARLALGRPPLAPGADLYLRLLAEAAAGTGARR